MTANINTHVEVVLVQNTVVHVNSGNENDYLGNRPKHPHFFNNNYLPKRPILFCQNGTFNKIKVILKRWYHVWCLVTQDLSSKLIYCIYMFILSPYTRCKFCIQVSIQVSWIQVFWSCIPYKKLESKNLNGLGWNRNASYFFSTWMELGWRLTNQKTESLSASICESK